MDKTKLEIKRLLIASDHGGFDLKKFLMENLPDLPWVDLGCSSLESVDYPDYANALARELAPDDMGVLICGTGQGMALRANRFPKIRAALCWNTDICQMAREHNDANVLCLAGRHTVEGEALNILRVFLSTRFAGGRHQRRVDKLSESVNTN